MGAVVSAAKGANASLGFVAGADVAPSGVGRIPTGLPGCELSSCVEVFCAAAGEAASKRDSVKNKNFMGVTLLVRAFGALGKDGDGYGAAGAGHVESLHGFAVGSFV